MRLLMLLEPGRATVAGLSEAAGRRMDSVMMVVWEAETENGIIRQGGVV